MWLSSVSCGRRKQAFSLTSGNILTTQKNLVLLGQRCGGEVGCGDEVIISLMLIFTHVKSTDCPRTGPSRTQGEFLRVIEQE